MATVSFAFYTGLGAAEPLINRLTAWFTGRHMHVEIVFHQPTGAHVACGVWAGETTFMRPKTFGKSCWEWRSVAVTRAQEAAIRRFCAAQAQAKVPFSRWAMARALTPFPRPTDGRTWFCSELCVAAMQAAGLLVDEVASATTPSGLWTMLTSLGAYAAASPLLERRISKAGELRCKPAWFGGSAR